MDEARLKERLNTRRLLLVVDLDLGREDLSDVELRDNFGDFAHALLTVDETGGKDPYYVREVTCYTSLADYQADLAEGAI